MTFDQIKAAINAGQTVHWMDPNYTVAIGFNGSLHLDCADGQTLLLAYHDGEFALDPMACYIA